MRDTFSAAIGRPVVAGDTADTIGEVRGFIIDTSASVIEAIHIDGRGRKAVVIPWANVQAFGPDAVVSNELSAAQPVADEHASDAVRGKISTQGARVLSTAGSEAGTIEDVAFDTATGKLIEFATTSGLIAAEHARALGSYALVVDTHGKPSTSRAEQGTGEESTGVATGSSTHSSGNG